MRDKVRMCSTESAHYYTTDKNKKKSTKKLEFKKYDPYLRKHVLYREDKIKG
jgi:large subunit ribosomal protein L33